MNYKEWLIKELDREAESLLIQYGLPPLAAKVLAARGVKTANQAKEYINAGSELIPDPKLLTDMEKACTRIRSAIDNRERIAVYGDYDVDGITATCLVMSWLREKGANCIYYIPDRNEDGYGVTAAAIDQIVQDGVNLIITVDLGITALEEAKYAASKGLDLIITDHHECRDQLPAAYAVINPLRKEDAFPFKELSGVGVAFMLVLAFEGMDRLQEVLTKYSDLVAIGTVSDVMPLVTVNRALVARGIEEINRGSRIGLKTLLKESIPEDARLNSGLIGFSVAPRINAAGRMGCAASAAELLLTDQVPKAQELTEQLCELNRMRQKTENDTYDETVAVSDRYIRENKHRKLGALVLSDSNWHLGVIGIIASRLSERYACPVFLISLENGIGKGSARSFYGVNILQAMQKASNLFESWGGHEFAAGFTIKEENIPALRELLEGMSCELGNAHIHIDAVLDTGMLNESAISGMSILEPYGTRNPMPIFLLTDVEVMEIIPLGWGKSLRLTIKKNNECFSAFYFGMNMSRLEMCEGDTGDAVCRIEVYESKGKKAVRLVLYDLRPNPEEYKRYRMELDLFQRFLDGEEISQEEAQLLNPQKQEFIAMLRHIKRNCGADRSMTIRISSLCRRVCREERLQSASYGKFMVCLQALAEKNRLSYKLEDEVVRIELMDEIPANLNTSKTIIRLRSIMEDR